MAFRRSVIAACAVAGAAAFAPTSVVPRVAHGGATGLCMSAGTGKIRKVAAFRGAPPGKAGLPPVEADPDSIDMDLVNGVPRFDTVGGIDKTYTKPPSSFFSGAFAKPARAAPKPAARAAPKPAARAAPKPAARAAPKPAARAASVGGRLGSRAAPKPAARAAPKPAAKPAAQAGGRLGSVFGRKPAAEPAAKPAAKPLPARPAPVQRGALRGTMRIGK